MPDAGAPHLERLQPCDRLTVLRPHAPLPGRSFDDEPVQALLRPRAVIYDCIDELAAGPDAPRPLREREGQLLRTADLVLTGGPSLWQAKRALNANVHGLPSSADAAHFAPERITANCEQWARPPAVQPPAGAGGGVGRVSAALRCVSRFSWDEAAQTVMRLVEQALERKSARRVAANDEPAADEVVPAAV